jgi:copper transport protein
VSLTVDSPRTGDAVLRVVTSTSDGRAKAVQKLTGSLSLPSRGVGPLPIRLERPDAAPSGQENVGLTFPSRGDWSLKLTVQTSALDAITLSVTVQVS